MTKLNLGGNMPSAKVSNGLLDQADDIAANPLQTILVIAEIDVNTLKVNPHTQSIDPTLQLTHIEPLTGKLAEQAEALLNKAFQARTGERVRPSKETPTPDTPLDLDGIDDSVDANA